ncbi:T9SS type A sorting domain-containing protein [Flavobacterium columnare]|uniref:T9SS type A sorting domain-containing protein n=1 Tax=Flavobacterium columnare TaxID=996 RepID=UPI0017836699|nr:T9SS type A sorting domain-containing protein [Flavobacterium columnare]QOG89919.1 T9SS type A sorting domain-containing protein [Flavobacterium columnare]QOG92575.1 T9SS type A sorting domain-containing protein [Flavobacterium columnare]QOG95240.1 T9SS type A sorting domain-containing protein [Flavobacterium columnare]QOG97900.1 T9SS type A sorting domain-containing protein [Flavobacterium columnare]QOH00559.1 T9SS type A sorting domain-containing protein [Flavobacterium columnare]
MKNSVLSSVKYGLAIILNLANLSSFSQNQPFNCNYNAYLFQMNDLYAINLSSGTATLIATDITPGTINAAGYNPTDGYMWGSLSTPANTIVRIGADFQTTSYYIPQLPTGSRFVGDIRSDGVYFLKIGSFIYQIDVNPNSATYGQYITSYPLSTSINVYDWAFNAVDGNLYTVEKSTNILYRITPSTGSVQSLGEVPIIAGLNYTYGAVYFDVDGNFYVSSNDTGTIYIIRNVQNLTGSNIINSNLFAFGPSSSSNDGARCPTAPVPQEDCSNGIDDDGDGLVDCDDPSCSGTGSCAVVDETSGGNNGGLESNNRLGDAINKRNYNRVKTNYTFDRNKASRIEKNARYASRNTRFTLQSFIPLQVLNEDSVIESTPFDLTQITNATDVYSVDYIKNNKTIGSMIAIKTNNGVYEHTKYICDRLLGAEILSVSTIQLNEQNFIRSIIKNTDGTIEYSMSLAARLTNNENNFSIDSHWNLDKYQQNTTYYNFQIWTNSLDNLYKLGAELISLINNQKTITEYNVSNPPTVFVKKGKYSNGKLYLDIINPSGIPTVDFDGGKRLSETSTFENFTTSINLDKKFLVQHDYPIGSIFDVGMRIGKNTTVPDDLFLSDGPWGLDSSAKGTTVLNYKIQPNNYKALTNEFPVERNVSLSAKVSNYISVYRALTPRFQAVNLSDYNSFKFRAKGSGNLEIRFIKSSISNWENQPYTTVKLTNSWREFNLSISSLINNSETVKLDDVKTIVFIMTTNGQEVIKELALENIRFSENRVLVSDEPLDVAVYPNPVNNEATIEFIANEASTMKVQVVNQLGKIVMQFDVDTNAGFNSITLSKRELPKGIYFCKIVDSNDPYKTTKLFIN